MKEWRVNINSEVSDRLFLCLIVNAVIKSIVDRQLPYRPLNNKVLVIATDDNI